MPKRKHVKKNRVVPCADTNVHARERIANRIHKSEVIQRKIEQMMEQRRKELEEQQKAKLDSSTPTLNPSLIDPTFVPKPISGNTEENSNTTE